MYLRGDMRNIGALAALVALFLSFIPSILPAQSTSSPQGCDDLLKLASGIGRNVDSVFINKEVCDAYRFLLERNGNGDKGTQCYRSQADRVLKLNPGFAVNLYKTLEEIERQFGGKSIVQSGFRCDGSSGNHPKGCAADIIWPSCSREFPGNTEGAWRCSSDRYDAKTNTWTQPEQQWIDANGRKYGIHLRIRGAPEGHHVEPIDVQGCKTGAIVGSGAPPSSGLSDLARRTFGLPIQQAQPVVSQPAYPSQPASASQNPLSAFNDNTNTIGGVSGQITPGTVTMGSSTAADRLEQLAFPKPATSSSATSVPLVISGSNAAVLSGSQNASTSAVATGQGLSSPTQTTFSGDLSWQGSETVSSAPVSGLQAVLITIRATLTRILQYLVPFGAREEVHLDEYDY